MTTELHTLIDEVKSYSNQEAIDNAVAFLEKYGERFEGFEREIGVVSGDSGILVQISGRVDVDINFFSEGSIFIGFYDLLGYGLDGDREISKEDVSIDQMDDEVEEILASLRD